jgi:cytochrome P450 family 110
MRLRQQIDKLIYAEIAERKAEVNSSRTDILSLMMATRDEAGEPMTDVELRDELMTLLIAGHETTATSLTWALYWIHKHPEVQEKLLQELETLEEPLEDNAIFRLPYLNAVCSETLRIYPVAINTLTRLVKSPLKLGGYEFAPGTLLIPSVYLTHHREDLYPDSFAFQPERFLERQFSAFEYLPFGGGNRRCLGMAFALFEMKLVLATVVANWEMELTDSQRVQPVRKGLLFGPKGGVQMVIKGRRKQNQLFSKMSSV